MDRPTRSERLRALHEEQDALNSRDVCRIIELAKARRREGAKADDVSRLYNRATALTVGRTATKAEVSAILSFHRIRKL